MGKSARANPTENSLRALTSAEARWHRAERAADRLVDLQARRKPLAKITHLTRDPEVESFDLVVISTKVS